MFFLVLLGTLESDMKCWAVSDAGDKWSVKLDIRDLGGHLDSTFRARAVTLGFRMSAAVTRVRAVAVLPLDFIGGLRILRTMHLPGALHGAEASLVSVSGLRKLRTTFCQASLSGGFRLANPGAVLSLLDMALLVLILVFTLSGVVLGCCVGIWRITPLFMNLLGFIVFFELSLAVLQVMVLFIC